MTDNPFDITQSSRLGSPKRPRYSNVWTEEEKEDKLKGYLEINRELWPLVKHSTHVRYITTDDEFRSGGFVLKNDVDNSTLRLQSCFNKHSPSYSMWMVEYNNMSKLYIKVDASIQTLVQTMNNTIISVNANMKKITDYVKKLDDRIKKIER